MRNKVTSQLFSERMTVERSTGKSMPTVNEEVLDEVEASWANESFRYAVCPPKKILAGLNSHLQSHGLKAVSFEAIAKHAKKEELDPELIQLLGQIESLGS
jgi:hypothetical protein